MSNEELSRIIQEITGGIPQPQAAHLAKGLLDRFAMSPRGPSVFSGATSPEKIQEAAVRGFRGSESVVEMRHTPKGIDLSSPAVPQ